MAEFSPHSGIIKDGEHILPLRVYYEDTDAGGIVYYANYLKYLERGRSDMLRILGVEQQEMLLFNSPDDVKFVVTRAEIDYLRPAKLDDVVKVRTKVDEFRKASFTMQQEIWRDDELLIKAVIMAAALNKNNRPARIPEQVRKKLDKVG